MKRGIEAPADVEAGYGGPRSVSRVLALFDALSRARAGMSLTALGVALNSPKSSVLNLLRPLLADGYVVHVGAVYDLGPAMFRLSAGVMATWDFPRLMKPYLAELSARTRETAVLSLLDRSAQVVSYVDIIECAHPVRYHIPMGTIRPILGTAAGMVMLASVDEAWRTQYLRSVKFPVRIEHGDWPAGRAALTRGALLEELERVRTEGVAISLDRYIEGVSAVAAPVYDAQSKYVAALTVAGPTERFRSGLRELTAVIRDVAMHASGALAQGGAGPAA